MSGEARPATPFAMVGDAEAAMCVDGVCEVPAPASGSRNGGDAAPADDGAQDTGSIDPG